MLRPTLLAAGLAALLSAVPSTGAPLLPGTPDMTTPAARDTDAVVLTGRDLLAGGSRWTAPENLTLAVPEKDTQCFLERQDVSCDDQYNHYQQPDVDTGGPVEGTPTDKILGYRWKATPGNNGGHWQQIPFQVDEVFTRYLNNNASGFGIYSGTDKHTTYAYTREGFRYWKNGEGDQICKATKPAGEQEATDPVKGLDTNDELAFMASDAGPQAPTGTALPKGIEGAKLVTITDPTNPAAAPSYVYIMRAGADGPKPAFDASNGYVHYQRDANFDTLVYSKSSYGDYGPAKQGPYCTPDGQLVRDANGDPKIGPRRELDGVTISTDRYRFRYDGRWLMTGVQIANDDKPYSDAGKVYGPDLVDRWKARAFAQDPGSQTPCCGYEEEDTNWGGSSSLLGEKVGPVRAIRETWGADSGTNVIRRETFYRDRMVQKTWLRVHVIPPLDGIYAQWDFNAGQMTKFFNAQNPAGVDVDGRNDEVYGNFDDPCNPRWDSNDTSQVDQTYRSVYKQAGLCNPAVTDQEHASVDPGDATFADANASLGWSQISGPNGTIVDRIHAQVTDQTPGGLAQSTVAVPYYRDDACFDDGTGSDPGPVMNLRSGNEPKVASDGTQRRCWKKGDPEPTGTDHYYQGSIGTHGLHILFLADSDNARLTVPVTEMVSDWDMVMLPPRQTLDKDGNPKNLGEQYGRATEKPLVAVVTDAQ